MSRHDELAQRIRESYDIIHEYEEIVQVSDRPEEVQRARRQIEDQWQRVRDPLIEYVAIAKRRNLSVPEDIAEIVATFGPKIEEAAADYHPPWLPSALDRRWMYGGAVLVSLLVIAALWFAWPKQPAAPLKPEATATALPPTGTSTATPSATMTATPPAPTATATATPVFGQGALYRVAIAEFDSQKASRQIEIVRRLEDDLRVNLDTAGLREDVDVRVLSDIIGTEDEARNFATEMGSDVLIWGWYDDLGIRLYVLLGESAQGSAVTSSQMTGLSELPLSAVNETSELSFYVHDVLPANTTFLSMYVIGHLYYLSNNYAAGYDAFDAAMANIPETVALENKALPHFFDARLMQSEAYTDTTEIICEYAKAIELDPELFEAYNNLAALIIDVCEYGGGVGELCASSLEMETACVFGAGIPSLQPDRLLSQTLQIRPDWALARYNLAVLDWEKMIYGYGDAAPITQQAKESFEAVLALDPTIVGAQIMLGNLAMWEEDFDLAVEYFTAASDLWPESPGVAVNLGQALALTGDDEDAIAAYRRALSLSSEGSEPYLEAHLALGTLYHRRGDLERAAQEYQVLQPFAGSQDAPFDCALSLALSKYDLDTGAWMSATQRLEPEPHPCGLLRDYLLWLIYAIQDDPEARAYVFDGGIGAGKFMFWTGGDAARMMWAELYGECYTPDADITTWGSESDPCLPRDLEDRLEAVYARFQRHVHNRLFFNQQAIVGMGACPYVFTYDASDDAWHPDTTILYKLIGPEAEQVQARPLSRFDGRLWVRELEPETSYIDHLYVRLLTVDGGWLSLRPDDPALAAADGDYLILHEGDGQQLVFDLPPDAPPIRQAWVVVAGYYVPYGEEE